MHAGGAQKEFKISTWTMEWLVAAIILLFGLTFLVSSYQLGAGWGSSGPESGFFPLYVSLFICLASGTILIQTLVKKDPKNREKVFVTGHALKQVAAVLLPSIVYVGGIQLIGIYVSSAIYIALFMRFIGKYSWWKSVVLGLAISVAFFFMFEVWFKVQLYKGAWDLTGWTGY